MADNPEASGDNQITFKVKTSGDSSHVITISENVTVLDLKTKLSGADFENIPVERQRLIYSGRVMKNDDTLSTYKIKNNNTIHMVKSAASNANQSASTSSTTPTPQAPQNMASGTANTPLAGLTGARYAGHQINMPNLDMFGPDGGMGPPMDEERMQRMMADPNVQQSMNEALNNPDVVNMLIDSHPMLRNMPNAREIIQSPFMRQMMSNPQMMSQAMRMQRSMQGGDSAFPAPGATDTTPEGTAAGGNAQGSNQNQNQQNPFGNPFMNPFLMPGLMGNQQGGQGGNNQNQPDLGAVLEQLRQLNSLGLNSFGNMQNQGQTATGQAGTATTPSQGATGSEGATQTEGNNPREGGAQQGTSSPPPANPFAALFGGAGGNANPFGGTQGNAANPFGINPEMMQQMMQMFGGGGGSPAPQDNRPPEERYEEQLRQLNDMGFFDFDRNVAALRRSGGSVQGAVEFLLSGN